MECNATFAEIKETRNLNYIPCIGSIVSDLTVGALMIDQQTGQSYALLVSPLQTGRDMDWNEANDWANQHGLRLPSRTEAMMLYTNNGQLGEAAFEPEQHWLHEHYLTRNAWIQFFDDGSQVYGHKAGQYAARAVTRIDITI